MVDGNLLSLIANPPVADIPGSLLAGQLGRQQLQGNQQTLDANLLQQAFFDSAAAFIMPPEKRKPFLLQASQKFSRNPAFADSVQKLIALSPEDQDTELLQMIQLGTTMGILPSQKVEKPTSLVQNAIAAGLKPGTPEFQEFIKEVTLKPTTRIEITEGRIPPGFRKTKTGELEPIPGGPAAMERQELIDNIALSTKTARNKAQTVLGKVGEALGAVNSFTTAIPGIFTGLVPGSAAFNLSQTLDTIKANLGFDKLQEMRDLSPTGGALGQVSERELAQLERALTSLERKQSAPQLRKNLLEVQTHYQKWLETVEKSNQIKASRLGVSLSDIDIITPVEEAVITNHPVYGNITEEDIKTTLDANPEIDRETLINQLRQEAGTQ